MMAESDEPESDESESDESESDESESDEPESDEPESDEPESDEETRSINSSGCQALSKKRSTGSGICPTGHNPDALAGTSIQRILSI